MKLCYRCHGAGEIHVGDYVGEDPQNQRLVTCPSCGGSGTEK